jgi:chromosome segregation ATPase
MMDRLKNIFGAEDIEQIAAKITEHSTLLKEQNELIKQLKDNLQSMTKEVSEFREEHGILQQVFDKNLDHVKSIGADFQKEIADFKMLKARIEETMADRVSVNLNEKLTPHINRIKTDAQTYNTLKDELTQVTSNLNQLKEEIARLKDISSKIKASDFELKVYANELLKQDQNKLELMKRIEMLERMIASERRKKY